MQRRNEFFINYYLATNRTEKIVWILIYLSLISLTFYISITLWFQLLRNPTIIFLEDANFPVSEMPFPGVGFCSNNKISLKKAKLLATDIANNVDVDFTYVMKSIKLLASMYTLAIDNETEMRDFQNILDLYNRNTNTNMKYILKNLTPSCDDFLMECFWGGKPIVCNKLLFFMLTFEGYCCVFNNMKIIEEGDTGSAETYYGREGLENGLTVLIRNDIDDFYSKSFRYENQLLIYSSSDFPDVVSGSLETRLIPINVEVFVNIKPAEVRASQDISRYAISRRRCYFYSEKQTDFGYYTHSDCLVDCRMNSMLSLCHCIPFTIPVRNMDANICTMNNLECLKKYERKWTLLAPMDVDVTKELEFEIDDGLRCGRPCYVTCDDTYYLVGTSFVPIKNQSLNTSIVHVYMNNAYGNSFKHDVIYYWYDILSFFGGIFGIFLGISVVNVVEILAYILWRLYYDSD